MAQDEEERREIGVQRLGTYMLKGWVMTDTGCANRGCGIPTLRTKTRDIEGFCCLCNDAAHPIPPFAEREQVGVFVEGEWEVDREVGAKKMDVSSLLGKKLLAGWTVRLLTLC
jgi:uncharacterized Zn finger protein (UPF0148 family)